MSDCSDKAYKVTLVWTVMYPWRLTSQPFYGGLALGLLARRSLLFPFTNCCQLEETHGTACPTTWAVIGVPTPRTALHVPEINRPSGALRIVARITLALSKKVWNCFSIYTACRRTTPYTGIMALLPEVAIGLGCW